MSKYRPIPEIPKHRLNETVHNSLNSADIRNNSDYHQFIAQHTNTEGETNLLWTRATHAYMRFICPASIFIAELGKWMPCSSNALINISTLTDLIVGDIIPIDVDINCSNPHCINYNKPMTSTNEILFLPRNTFLL